MTNLTAEQGPTRANGIHFEQHLPESSRIYPTKPRRWTTPLPSTIHRQSINPTPTVTRQPSSRECRQKYVWSFKTRRIFQDCTATCCHQELSLTMRYGNPLNSSPSPHRIVPSPVNVCISRRTRFPDIVQDTTLARQPWSWCSSRCFHRVHTPRATCH